MGLFFEITHNSFMQSLVLGPLMGVVFSALFSVLTKSAAAEVPPTIIHTQRIYITRVAERSSSSSNSNDGAGFLILGGVALLFVVWKYAIYFDAIHYYLAFAILTIMSFSFTTMLISFLKGHYTSSEWWVYTLGPLLALLACAFLLNLARESFDPSIQAGALNNTFWTFYKEWLTDYGRNFMFAHVSGIVLLALVVLLVSMSLIYYLALMNQRSGGAAQGVWIFLARITSFFSGKFWPFLIAFLLFLSYLGLNPELAAMWLSTK